MTHNLDGLTVEQLRTLVRTIDMYGQGFIWHNPRTGEDILLPPADVTVVVGAPSAYTYPEITRYGSAVMSQADDGTITVSQADNRIGVSGDLWDQLDMPHKRPDGTLWLDTAGEYRYRRVGTYFQADVLVFDRLADKDGPA
jgi:hypothetical protein